MKKSLILSLIALLVFGLVSIAAAGEVIVSAADPEGDDNGPGNYTYPTDKVFTKGSFDITNFSVEVDGDNAIFTVGVKGRITNPWNLPGGFSVQTIDIYIDQDGVKDSGLTDTVAGRRVKIAPESAWEKCVVIAPEFTKYAKELETKSKALVGKVIVPTQINVKGKSLSVTVPIADLGAKPDKKWGYVVLMMGSEGYPAKDAVLTREVLANKAQWRFGGGSDKNDDPNIIDIWNPEGSGLVQADELKWEEGKQAVLHAVYGDKLPSAPAATN